MSRISDVVDRLTIAGNRKPVSADMSAVELVFATTRRRDQVEASVSQALPDHTFELEGAVSDDVEDCWFVRFPGLKLQGHEPDGFALARELARAVGALEGNLAGADSLYGGDAVSLDKTLSGVCDTLQRTEPRAWHHVRVKATGAWARSRGAGAVVGVIDTGHTSHSELDGVFDLTRQRNVLERQSPNDAHDRLNNGPQEHPGHGTLVASVIASRGDVDGETTAGSQGVVTGIAPEATLVPIRAIRTVLQVFQWQIPKAIDHAVESDCAVIVMCFGGPFVNGAVRRALRRAVKRGVVVVCAAGNCWPWVVFPAAYAPFDLSVAIGAICYDWTPWDKTPTGHVTVAAPGENVWGARVSTEGGDPYSVAPSQGTTLATSITAGVAALWVAHHGADALRKLARDRNTTVQALFAHAVVQGAQSPPKPWSSADRRRVGAGVVNAEAVLDVDLGSIPKSALRDLPGIPSNLDLLKSHVAMTGKSAVVTDDAAEYAAELIWLSYIAGARQRALKHAKSDQLVPMPTPSEDAAGHLAKHPDLADALGLT